MQKWRNHDLALNEYNKAIKINPKLFQIYLNRGILYMDYEKYDDAIKDFNKVISLDNSNYYAYNYRGYCYASKGDMQKLLMI